MKFQSWVNPNFVLAVFLSSASVGTLAQQDSNASDDVVNEIAEFELVPPKLIDAWQPRYPDTQIPRYLSSKR